jgi:hypothetical protein
VAGNYFYVPMKILLFATCLLFILNTEAQTISGKLMDKSTMQPLRYILVGTKTANTFTDDNGSFKLKVNLFDTIRIKSMGYKPFAMPVSSWDTQIKLILLEPTFTQLAEVKITGQKNYHKDSVNLRKEYEKQFNFRGPRFNEIFLAPSNYVPFAVMSINVTMLYKALTKKHDPNYKLQQTLLRDERENHITARFNKALVTAITRLQGDSLGNFMSAYRPTAILLDKLTDYDLVRYIKTNLEKFRVNAVRPDELPVMLKPEQSLEE